MALHQERRQMSLVEELPVDALTHALEYINIVDRIKFARCSTTLQHRVYRECSKVWKIVLFSELDSSFRERLTDVQVFTLLDRIDAKNVTEGISLLYCPQIRGAGLTAIESSRVLTSLNLAGTSVAYNEVQVLRIIGTMTPFRLAHVIFSDDEGKAFQDFKRTLRYQQLQKAKQEETRCFSCDLPTMDKERRVIPNAYGFPFMLCHQCDHPFCRRASCPMNVVECKECGDTFCSDCRQAAQCSFCGHAHCNNCIRTYECNDCKTLSCDDCYKVVECSSDGCDNLDCKECGTCPEVCSKGHLFCKSCQATNECANCTGKFCFICDKDSQGCSVCSKKFCGKSECVDCATKCGACEEVFCADCNDFECCARCMKYFCVNHNRLVDCATCHMKHCRTCIRGERCQLCGVSCFEACVCEPRAKRARVS